MRSIVTRRATVSVFVIVLLLAATPTATAQREMDLPVAFTTEPAPEVPQDLQGTTYLLGSTGSGSHPATDCAEAGSNEFVITWVSEPVFVPQQNFTGSGHVATIVNDVPVTFQITAADPGTGQALPQPVAFAPVELALKVSWIRPIGTMHGPHEPWTGATVIATSFSPVPDPGVPLPLGAGILNSSVSFALPFTSDASALEAGSRLVLELFVTCPQAAYFTLNFGGFGPIRYVWGSPTWGDVDADGIPDEYDEFPDGTQWSKQQQELYGTNWRDPNDTPDQDSICPGFTIQEAVDQGFERDNPATCPGGGGFPWLILLIALLGAVLLMGAAFGAVTAVNRKVRMEVSHDGFQDIPQGGSAVYTLALTARGKEGEETPVELSLKGVPEDWSAAVEPSNILLIAGENPEPVTATLRVTPPPSEEYEAEAVVTVTATPTDADGKTSPLKPGTAVKTKTIVNIDKEAPEGKKGKRVKPAAETMAAAPMGDESGTEEESGKRGFGMAFLKRKKKDDEPPAEAGEGTVPQEAATATPAPSGAGKPDLAVGKMTHNPADFSEGDTVTTTVPVRNKGDAPVEGLMLRLYVNDERVDEKEVNLLPGATAEVTFTWTAQPDENRVRVRGGLKEA